MVRTSGKDQSFSLGKHYTRILSRAEDFVNFNTSCTYLVEAHSSIRYIQKYSEIRRQERSKLPSKSDVARYIYIGAKQLR